VVRCDGSVCGCEAAREEVLKGVEVTNFGFCNRFFSLQVGPVLILGCIELPPL